MAVMTCCVPMQCVIHFRSSVSPQFLNGGLSNWLRNLSFNFGRVKMKIKWKMLNFIILPAINQKPALKPSETGLPTYLEYETPSLFTSQLFIKIQSRDDVKPFGFSKIHPFDFSPNATALLSLYSSDIPTHVVNNAHGNDKKKCR